MIEQGGTATALGRIVDGAGHGACDIRNEETAVLEFAVVGIARQRPFSRPCWVRGSGALAPALQCSGALAGKTCPAPAGAAGARRSRWNEARRHTLGTRRPAVQGVDITHVLGVCFVATTREKEGKVKFSQPDSNFALGILQRRKDLLVKIRRQSTIRRVLP
jgi:hypothetical protein